MPPLLHCFISCSNDLNRSAWCAVENQRLAWELSQLQGAVDTEELARLRSETNALRQQMLQMHTHMDHSQVSLAETCLSEGNCRC